MSILQPGKPRVPPGRAESANVDMSHGISEPMRRSTRGLCVALTNGADTQILGPSQSRYAITFSVVGTTLVPVSIGVGVLTGPGDPQVALVLYPGMVPVKICMTEQGGIVRFSWHAWATVSGLSVAILETIQ